MHMLVKGFAVVAMVSATAGLTLAAPKPADAKPSRFEKLVDEFFDNAYFNFRPTEATSVGFHQYDSQLEDYSKAGIDKNIAALRTYRAKIEAGKPKSGTIEESDRDLILHFIDGALLEFESIRQWEKNPDRYSSNISNSAFLIMARKFAAPEERLRSLIAREKQMPAVFDAARANLKNPPRVYTDVAISQLPGIISFFEKDVPLAFKDVTDKNLIAEFGQSNGRVVEALRAY
jgi:hypothetical protein